MSVQSSPPDPLRKPNEKHVPWLLRRIWDRLNRKNEHFMGVIVGEEGSGKSYTALRIAESIDPTFSEERVIFDVGDLLEVLQNGNHEPGQFWVLDEAGVQFGVRTWQERGQVLANQALQLIRNHNLGLLFTLPRLGELDSQAQGRLQAFLELTDKEHGEFVTGKWKWMDPDRADETGKIYKKFPRRRQNGRVMRITSLSFTPPSEELVEPYEKKKTEFQKEFYEKTLEELGDGEDESEEEEDESPKDIADRIAGDGLVDVVAQHPQNHQYYIDKDLIRANYETSHRDARAVKKLLERRYEDSELEAAYTRDTHSPVPDSD